MSNGSNTNGRTGRKSLSDQIDRLDDILDGLAGALQDAVADAVKEVVGPAVRDAVREAVVAAVQAVLTNPNLRGVLATENAPVGETATTRQSTPGVTRRLAVTARAAARGGLTRVRGWLGSVKRAAGLAVRLHRPLGLATGVGAALALACYLAGPHVAAAVGGMAGFAFSLLASSLRAVRRVVPATGTQAT